MTTIRCLLSLSFIVASASLPAFAQSLALTYQLAPGTQAQRAGTTNCGVGSSSCNQHDALGRYSRQGQNEENVSRFFAPAGRSSAAPAREEPRAIPALGEQTRDAEPAAQGEPEFNLKIERPRVRQDIERRFQDAAQEARFNRKSINALGFELLVPIQAKVQRSADPELPQ